MERITHSIMRVFNKQQIRKFSDHKSGGGGDESLDKHRANLMARGLPKKKPIPGVERIVMIASGKGGVGKTTTAVNLACALKAVDPSKEIGILDADVFGPSVPLMMNISEEPMLNQENLMEPLINYGVKCMSMGLLVKGEGAVVWRGLMVMQALERLTRQVAWGPLDCLVIDTPPGTGDTHLSLAQSLPIDGAIVVTTPQMAAIQVTRRGVTMLEKLHIPIFGIIENMAHSRCLHCGSKNHIFGINTEHLSKQMNIPVLESFPLQQSVSEGTACGKPVVLTDPNSEYSKKYRNLANRLYCMFEK